MVNDLKYRFCLQIKFDAFQVQIEFLTYGLWFDFLGGEKNTITS